MGDVFNPDGIECNALYSNGKIYVINTGLSYKVDMTEAGPKEVTVFIQLLYIFINQLK